MMSNTPAKPKAPEASAPAAKSGIQITTNDAVDAFIPATVESVVEDRGNGITVETFVGLQQGVAWVDTGTTVAPAIPADAFGDE